MDRVLQQFLTANQTHHLWQSDDTVVVAVSTGVDSMTLLDTFFKLANFATTCRGCRPCESSTTTAK
ncbi:hypothetical protein ACUKBL_00350 [Furfurilactobacillus rossiae]